MSVKEYASILAEYRSRNARASYDVYEKGSFILHQPNGLNKLGPESWAFLEQLALAALDLGHLDVANECISKLEAKFPASPRVDALIGIRLEHSGKYDEALLLYDNLLGSDATNAAIWKRKISVLRQTNQIASAVEELVTFVDKFYGDPEAWLELADIYASIGLYLQSLSSLTHVLLLMPQNPFYVLRAAETAFTAQDIPLALKFFLRAVEMLSDGGGAASTRGWYGVKLCARRLLYPPSSASNPPSSGNKTSLPSHSPSDTPLPTQQHLTLLDELATERILAAYSSPSVERARTNEPPAGTVKPQREGGADVRGVVIRWLQGK